MDERDDKTPKKTRKTYPAPFSAPYGFAMQLFLKYKTMRLKRDQWKKTLLTL
jgi:hypothetical protein